MIELSKTETAQLQVWVNTDTSLSEFKYHFILRRVHIPKLQFVDFASSVYRGFRTPLVGPHSIYIVQIVETYDNAFYDFAVGFRKNSQAIAVYKSTKKFYTPTKQSQIEVAQAFRIYLEALVKTESPRKQGRGEESSWQREEGSRSRQRNSYRSVSRSRSREGRKEESRFYLALLPLQIRRDRVRERIAQYAGCGQEEVEIEEQSAEFPCWLVTVRGSVNLQGFYRCIPEGLVIAWEQVYGSGVRGQVRKHQIRASKLGVHRPTQQSFLQLAHWLVGVRGDVKVLHIMFQDSSFLVTLGNRRPYRELRLPGWRFEMVHHTPRMVPSLQDRWYVFISKYYEGYFRVPVEG